MPTSRRHQRAGFRSCGFASHRLFRSFRAKCDPIRTTAAVHLHAKHTKPNRQVPEDKHPKAIARGITVDQYLHKHIRKVLPQLRMKGNILRQTEERGFVARRMLRREKGARLYARRASTHPHFRRGSATDFTFDDQKKNKKNNAHIMARGSNEYHVQEDM